MVTTAFQKCLRDPLWRINNLYKVINKQGEIVTFKMNWAQLQLYSTMWYCNVILKARQLGMTTFIQIFFLDRALFNTTTSCGVIAHNRDDAEKFFEKKIKFAYEHLPPEIKCVIGTKGDSAKQLTFVNDSIISVGTSLRSDTLQYLHVSEYGKSCAKFPEKAKEIRTGALNTLATGTLCFIESTAEGNYGDFYKIATNALGKMRAKTKLTQLDYKMFFFPWQKHPEYTLASDDFDLKKEIPQELHDYFNELQKLDGITLSDDQKFWYSKKYEVQQDEMVREYPSTPEEAFSVPLHGAYYEVQIRRMINEKRLTKVGYDESLPVHTFWDLGIHDLMSLWFAQFVGNMIQIIDYYANTGKGFLHYKRLLDSKPYYYGQHFGPHDLGSSQHTAKDEPETRLEIASKIGLEFVQLPPEKDVMAGIQRTRAMFSRVIMDSDKCCRGEQSGFAGLQSYRKAYNDKMACYEDRPVKNWTRNPADAFRYISLADSEGMIDNYQYIRQAHDDRIRDEYIDRRSTVNT